MSFCVTPKNPINFFRKKILHRSPRTWQSSSSEGSLEIRTLGSWDDDWHSWEVWEVSLLEEWRTIIGAILPLSVYTVYAISFLLFDQSKLLLCTFWDFVFFFQVAMIPIKVPIVRSKIRWSASCKRRWRAVSSRPSGTAGTVGAVRTVVGAGHSGNVLVGAAVGTRGTVVTPRAPEVPPEVPWVRVEPPKRHNNWSNSPTLWSWLQVGRFDDVATLFVEWFPMREWMNLWETWQVKKQIDGAMIGHRLTWYLLTSCYIFSVWSVDFQPGESTKLKWVCRISCTNRLLHMRPTPGCWSRWYSIQCRNSVTWRYSPRL